MNHQSMEIRERFQTADYLLFAITIVVSVAIGVFYALSGGKQRTTSEYLLASRQMPFLPVAISLFVSFESSIMMLGLPAETYMFGIQIVIALVSSMMSTLIAAWIVVPLMYPLKITSIYEYLELRFDSRAVRLLTSFIGIVNDLFYIAIVLFGPAVALQGVTGFPLGVSIGGLAVVSILYTAIGGLKAVIWTDVFQSGVMFAGIFAVLIKGTLDSGGAKAVWKTAASGGRLEFFNFDLDPRTRHTFWNLSVAWFIRGFTVAFKQSTLQRICSTLTMRDAKRVLIFIGPASFLIACLACYEGIVAYSYYARKECDPFASNQLTDANQIVPYIVMDIFKHIPCMPGLFVAALFSASLSTLSSCLSGQSSLLWTDFVHPIVGDIPEWKATLIAKVSVVVFGCLSCGIAFLISLIGGTLHQISSVLLSSFSAPLSGIFFLGCFCPRANAKGTLMAAVLTFILILWISLGMSFSPGVQRTSYLPPSSVDGCFISKMHENETSYWSTNQTKESIHPVIETTTLADVNSAQENQPNGIAKLYTISYTLIPIISIVCVIVFGNFFSILTGANKPGDVDPRYILPMSESLFCWLPKSARRRLRSIGTQFILLEKTDEKSVHRKENIDKEIVPMIETIIDGERNNKLQNSGNKLLEDEKDIKNHRLESV